jgi:hypothetical protein
MIDRKLMQQALDALEYADACLKKQLTTKTKHEYAQDLLLEAGTALRDRLAQPKKEPKCGAIIEVFGKDWRLDYMSLPVGKHKLYTQQYIYTAPQPQMQPCAGRNCGSTNPNLHSAECFEDYEKATGMDQLQTLMDERIESVRHMRNVQGYDGNWNYDPYMQGLYNGLEFALSLLEVRQPEFKDAPATWLGDSRVNRDNLSSASAQDIKEQE